MSLLWPTGCPVIPDPFLGNSSELADLPEFDAVRFCSNGQELVAFSLNSQQDANSQVYALAQNCASSAAGALSPLSPSSPITPWQYCADAICSNGTLLATVCSPISQDDADTIAAAIADACCDGSCSTISFHAGTPNGGRGDIGDNGTGEGLTITVQGNKGQKTFPGVKAGVGTLGPGLYPSAAQTGVAICPDGSAFTYALGAGYAKSTSQESADSIAQAHANQLALDNQICFGELDPDLGCNNVEFSGGIPVGTGPSVGVLTYELAGGALPDGIEITGSNEAIYLTGTPTVVGDYNFEIKGTDENGNFMQKPFSMSVVGFTTQSLPGGIIGVPYTAFLAASGPGPLVFSADPIILTGLNADHGVASGLVMDSQGHITGTPIFSGTYLVSATVDGPGFSCQAEFTITILKLFNGPFWDSLAWTIKFIADSGNPLPPTLPVLVPSTDTSFIGGTCAVGIVGCPKLVGDEANQTGSSIWHATGVLYYTGPAAFCQFAWLFTYQYNCSAGFAVYQDGNFVAKCDMLSNVSPFVFAIKAGVNSKIEIIGSDTDGEPEYVRAKGGPHVVQANYCRPPDSALFLYCQIQNQS
jgi:Putative Ig domain